MSQYQTLRLLVSLAFLLFGSRVLLRGLAHYRRSRPHPGDRQTRSQREYMLGRSPWGRGKK